MKIKKFLDYFCQAFFHHLSRGDRNIFGYGMQPCFSVRLGRYWVVWVQLSRRAIGVILERFTQLSLGRLCKAVHLLFLFSSTWPPPGLEPLDSCLGCLGGSPALNTSVTTTLWDSCYSWNDRYAKTKVKFKPSVATCTLTSSNASNVLTIFWQMHMWYILLVGQIIQLSYLSISLFLCYEPIWPPLPGHFGPPWLPKNDGPLGPPRGPQVFQSEGVMAPPAPPRGAALGYQHM